MKIDGKEIEISHKTKVLFTDTNIQKEDMIEYYQSIFSYASPYIEDRAVTMERYPSGINEKGFYMKDVPEYFPEWIETVTINNKDGTTNNQLVCNNVETLVYIVNQGCITPHIWLSKVDKLNKPDKIIFDLDPSKKNLSNLKKVAVTLRDILDEHDLTSYCMTTGSSGYHIIVPIRRTYSFDDVRAFASQVADEVVHKLSDIATTNIKKADRDDKIFIDTLRNSYGQTSVMPYAIRPIKNAPVATPFSWEELNHKPIDPRKYTIKTIKKRLAQIDNPWQGYFDNLQSIKLE